MSTGATTRDFPDLSRDYARAAARAAKAIQEALQKLTCCQIRRVLAWASARAADPCMASAEARRLRADARTRNVQTEIPL